MRNLGDTVARLKARPTVNVGSEPPLDRSPIEGPNPGGLIAWKRVPEGLPSRPALVVALHGCTQTAAAYDVGSGWSTLAEQYGFVVLYPEQQRANNPGLCFNWYAPGDARRDAGEAASIRSAIESVMSQHDIDRSRVFITGLSAGGAMASVLLATYPEVFAGGAVIAGLPFGAASTVPEAFERMRGQGLAAASASTSAVLAASTHPGPRPTISIWHGTADHTVSPLNADALVAQWGGVLGCAVQPDESTRIGRHTHRVWRDQTGSAILEDYRMAGMGHGVPIHTKGSDPCGRAGPYMIETEISSTRALATRWKLDVANPAKQSPHETRSAQPETTQTPPPSRVQNLPGEPAAVSHVQQVIEDALRRAGLMS